MRAVNLLPRDAGQNGVGLPSLPVLVGVCVGVLVTAVLAADFMMQSGKVTKEQRTLDSLEAQVAALPAAPPGPSAEQTQLAGEHSARVTALSSAMGNRVAWDRILREFSLVLPDDVWLTTLTAHSPVSPAATPGTAPSSGTTPTEFALTGRTYSHDGVARLLSRLQVVPDLQNVTLVSSTLSKVAGQDVVEFNIVADIRTAAPSSTSTPAGPTS
jgi:Tfp pilus assembly protein PilN